MRLSHFYHVFAVPGRWEPIVAEHLDALFLSGLDTAIDHLRLGVVGAPEERAAVLAMCHDRIPTVVVAQEDSGWEQITLRALANATDYDAVLYAHTKGVTHDPDDNAFETQWRRNMTEAVVTNWRQCVKLLASFDAVGPYWLTRDTDPGRLIPVFGGNHWWVRRALIARLPAVRTESRYDAEGWIGLGLENRDDAPGVYSLRKWGDTEC
jgi:hypothetical protein